MIIISNPEKYQKSEPLVQLEHEENGDKPNIGNSPVHLKWEPHFDFCTDKVTGEEPVCPACGEFPYNTERCAFCGQAFVQDEKAIKFSEPAPVEYMMCPLCFEPNGVEFTRSKLNGHKHGRCKACGNVLME